MAALGGFFAAFAAFFGLFLTELEFRVSSDFLGALDGQQLLVVEGSGGGGDAGV